jgi:hypothetical protein
MSFVPRKRLANFVNREAEMARFGEMLADPDAHVFVVWGPGGVGKSSLKDKMWHEVASQGLLKSEVEWTDTRNHDMIAITRKIRDDLGPLAFSTFTELMNSYTDPVARHELKLTIEGQPTIAVAPRANFTDSRAGDIAGIMVKDLMLPEPLRDMQAAANDRRIQLTDAFIEGVAAALADQTAVVFFDATEKMASETEKWVWGDLLPAACDGRMGNAKFVLCGRGRPEAARLLAEAIEVRELRPLTRDYVHAYLQRRGVEEERCAALADMLFVVTEGNLFELAAHVEGYLRFRDNRADAPGR